MKLKLCSSASKTSAREARALWQGLMFLYYLFYVILCCGNPKFSSRVWCTLFCYCCYYCRLPWTNVLWIRHKVIVLLSPPPTIDSESIAELFNSCTAQHLRFTTPPNWQSPSNLPFLLLPFSCWWWYVKLLLLLATWNYVIASHNYYMWTYLLPTLWAFVIVGATSKLKGPHPRSTNKQPRSQRRRRRKK